MNIALRAVLIACMLATVLPTPAGANMREIALFDYYPVTATSGRLSDALDQASAQKKIDARGSWGYTHAEIEWHYRISPAGDGLCHFTSIDTKLTITMTLPQLMSASPLNQREFDAYLPKLRMHEDGHAELGRSAARDVDKMLAAMGNHPCKTLSSDANKRGDAILDKMRAENADYDNETDHGRKQGAWLQD